MARTQTRAVGADRGFALELERAAAYRSALRRYLARTDKVTAAAGLTRQRYDLLLMIRSGRDQASTVTELSDRLQHRQPAVTELVKRAVKAGLVARKPSPADRRVSLLRLTEKGERLLTNAVVALRDDRRRLAEALSEVDARFGDDPGRSRVR